MLRNKHKENLSLNKHFRTHRLK